MASRLIEYLDSNQLTEKYQSAYRYHHSTETGLVRVQNDVLTALDKNQGAMLVFAGLRHAAAFDTMDLDVPRNRFI